MPTGKQETTASRSEGVFLQLQMGWKSGSMEKWIASNATEILVETSGLKKNYLNEQEFDLFSPTKDHLIKGRSKFGFQPTRFQIQIQLKDWRVKVAYTQDDPEIPQSAQ